MILPVVRLVGSSPSQLFEGWLQVSHDLGFALSHLNELTPHGRDYPENLEQAIKAHDLLAEKLLKLKAEVDDVVGHLCDSLAPKNCQNSI